MAVTVVWMEAAGEPGRLVDQTRAVVPVTDRGFAYGDGLFETVCVRRGETPLLPRHLERLYRSIRLLGGPDLSDVMAALPDRCYEVVAANRLENGYLRIVWSRGTGPRGFGLPAESQWMLCVQGGAYTARDPRGPGLTAALASWRVDPRHPACRVKSLSALDKVVAKTEAARLGVDELLFLNLQDHLTEAIAANLFLVTGDCLLTPSVDCGLLPGVARGFLLELAAGMGLNPVESKVACEALAEADEAFLCNALMGVAPLVAVDGRPVGRQSGPGAVTLRIHAHYEHAIDQLVRSAGPHPGGGFR